MSIKDYGRELLAEKKVKNKRHLELSCSNLNEDELISKLSYLFKELNDSEICNVNFCFSCDYWESDYLDEEDF